jgi:hypothetical protein
LNIVAGPKRDPENLNQLTNINYVYAVDLNDISRTLNLLIEQSNLCNPIFNRLNADLTELSGNLSSIFGKEDGTDKIPELSKKVNTLSANINELSYFNEHYHDIILCDLNCISTNNTISGIYEYNLNDSVIGQTSSLLIWDNYITSSQLKHEIINKNNTIEHSYAILDANDEIIYKTVGNNIVKSVLDVNWYMTYNGNTSLVDSTDLRFEYFKLSNYVLNNRFNELDLRIK